MSEAVRIEAPERASEEAVRGFLRSRPEFLKDDPELMQALGVRPDAANVVEFGPAALARVAQAHRAESGARRHLEAVARANFDAQSRTHDAVIELLGARNHADLANRFDAMVRAAFGLAAGVIALEGPERVPAGWRALAQGQCELTLGVGRAARLGAIPTVHGLFGPLARGVGSVALVRLSLWTPARAGLVAIAAESEDAFTPDMGHELIDFLARVIERTAERWPIL